MSLLMPRFQSTTLKIFHYFSQAAAYPCPRLDFSRESLSKSFCFFPTTPRHPPSHSYSDHQYQYTFTSESEVGTDVGASVVIEEIFSSGSWMTA